MQNQPKMTDLRQGYKSENIKYFIQGGGGIMKKTQKKKPVKTTPKGVWEASRSDSKHDKSSETSTQTSDLQGNGYQQNKSGN